MSAPVKLLVSSQLGYELQKPTDFVFQVHAAKTSTQTVKSEILRNLHQPAD